MRLSGHVVTLENEMVKFSVKIRGRATEEANIYRRLQLKNPTLNTWRIVGTRTLQKGLELVLYVRMSEEAARQLTGQFNSRLRDSVGILHFSTC